MLVGPVMNRKSQSPSFKALPINKLANDATEADIFRICARRRPELQTPENEKELLIAINQATDIEVKGLLTDIAQNVWHILKK